MTAGEVRPRPVMLVIALAAFVTALDTTVVTVALPAMGRDLGLSRVGLEWVATGYLLPFAALLLVGGRAADRFGRAGVLVAGTAIFVLASAAATWSPSGAALVLARVVQGGGAALLLPAALAVLAADLDERERRLAAGVWTAAIAAALALGPAVGGVLTASWGWRWVFAVNLPLGLLTIAMALAGLPRREGSRSGGAGRARRDGRWGRSDLPGLGTSALGLLALTGALLEWHAGGGRGTVVALLVAGVAWAAFVAVERRAEDPLVPPALWRVRAFTGGTLAQVLWGLGMNGVVFFTSLYLQEALGLGPVGAGLTFVPVAVSVAAAVPAAGVLADRCGAAATVAAGLAVVAAGLVAVALADPGRGAVGMLPGLVLVGLGSGLTTPLTACVLQAVPAQRAGVASAVVSTAREMSGALGIALVGLVLSTGEAAAGRRGAGPPEAFLAGYRAGLVTAAVLVLAGAVIAAASLRPAARPAAVPALTGAPAPTRE